MAGTAEEAGTEFVERRFAADDDAPRAARAMARDFIGGLDETSCANLYVALSELVTNAVLYGGTGDIGVWIGQTDHNIRIEVTDSGTDDFPWSGHPGPGKLRAHGLEIVAAFTNRFGIDHTPQTCAWCELDLPHD